MNIPAVGWPGTDTPSRVPTEGGASNGQGWQRSSHGNSGTAWQRWASGSMAQPHPGARVLNDAEGWWDADVYDGGRLWRNLGTAGAAADLITSPGSMPNTLPPHIRPAGEPFLRLWGRVAQSIACTAPATATSYAAYRLSSEASTPTTGAVTGGAAFAFAPSVFGASWTRVDLLDAGSNVVGQWTAAGTAWNGTTWGMTDGFAVVWTVTMNDSGYTNAVLMPTAAQGGRACFAAGTPNTTGLPVSWQNYTAGHLFDVTSGQDMTALFVVTHPTANSIYADYMAYCSRPAIGSDTSVTRWYLDVGISGTYVIIQPFVNGTAGTQYNWSTAGKTGVRFLYAMTTTRQGRSINQYINGTLTATQQLSASMVGTQGGGVFNLMNRNMGNSSFNGLLGYFYAAAFFRRSVSANDLAAIAAYYGCA